MRHLHKKPQCCPKRWLPAIIQKRWQAKKYYSIDAAREARGLFDVKERHLAGGDMGGVVRMTSDGWITWTLSDADGDDDDLFGG